MIVGFILWLWERRSGGGGGGDSNKGKKKNKKGETKVQASGTNRHSFEFPALIVNDVSDAIKHMKKATEKLIEETKNETLTKETENNLFDRFDEIADRLKSKLNATDHAQLNKTSLGLKKDLINELYYK